MGEVEVRLPFAGGHEVHAMQCRNAAKVDDAAKRPTGRIDPGSGGGVVVVCRGAIECIPVAQGPGVRRQESSERGKSE